MAQTGYTPIQLYYSSTTTNAPLAANLAGGELAINITDGKLFYKDNANVVQVIGWKVRPATAGGTGLTSFAVGDLLYADTTTTLAKLADVATGNALISGGVGVAPSWGKIGLTTHVSGVLPVANGGTNASAASITAFNNITGYTATGATGTTSTNLVFSTAPTITGLTYTNASTAAPTFSAYLGTNQVVSTGQTKIQLNTELWDTNSNYDNATNYRFTPTVAGYYQVNWYANTTSSTSLLQCSIYLNGTNVAAGSEPTTGNASQVAALIYMNGSTDYIEFYFYAGAGGGTVAAGRASTCASAAWVRST